MNVWALTDGCMDLMSLEYNESFVIDLKGEKVRITLLKNKDNPDEYAFGIDAPRSIDVNREEIFKLKNTVNS